MILTEREKTPLYVIGHKNPDTDAICSAIGNAEFLRRHGYPEAVAARCGELTQRTLWVLEQAGVPEPVFIRNATPTAASICRRDIISVTPDDTFLTTYKLMTAENLHSVPVVDGERKLHGMLRHLDLMALLFPPDFIDDRIRSVETSLRNIAETINAICLTEKDLSDEDEEIILLVGASSEPSIRTRLENYKRKGVVHKLCMICGDRPNVQLFAVEYGVRALVVTAGSHPTSDIRETAEESGTCILSTPWDTASVGQLIRCSRRVKHVVDRDVLTFSRKATLDDIQQLAVRHSQSLFPVVSRTDGTVYGVISKTDLVDPPRMRLALVDHNEFSQAVDGVEEAEIIEVMDHHRLGSQVSTREPIRFLNEPVGSTSTLVARRFFHRDEAPPAGIALCLCAGIISDTINLTSPTTTKVDRSILEWLAGIAKINPREFADKFFSMGSLIGSGNYTPEEIIQTDRKEFTEYDVKISISQVEEVGLWGFEAVRTQLEKALKSLIKAQKYKLACLLVTDINSHDSLLLAVGDEGVIANIDYERLDKNLFLAKGVVSRKKQLFPAISRALQASQ